MVPSGVNVENATGGDVDAHLIPRTDIVRTDGDDRAA